MRHGLEQFGGKVVGLGLHILGQRESHRSALGRIGEHPDHLGQCRDQLLGLVIRSKYLLTARKASLAVTVGSPKCSTCCRTVRCPADEGVTRQEQRGSRLAWATPAAVTMFSAPGPMEDVATPTRRWVALARPIPARARPPGRARATPGADHAPPRGRYRGRARCRARRWRTPRGTAAPRSRPTARALRQQPAHQVLARWSGLIVSLRLGRRAPGLWPWSSGNAGQAASCATCPAPTSELDRRRMPSERCGAGPASTLR